MYLRKKIGFGGKKMRMVRKLNQAKKNVYDMLHRPTAIPGLFFPTQKQLCYFLLTH